jgi:hydroxymethylglutaryl-CoA reductase
MSLFNTPHFNPIHMIDYQHFLYEEIPDLLEALQANTSPQWGKMDAQQMIEHLAYTIGFANGRFNMEPNAEPERLAYRKMRFFEKDVPFVQGLRVNVIPEEPMPHQFSDIEQSKDFMMGQLERFYYYHTEHPDLTPMHPVLGALNYDEWVQFHARHFRHHFTQFGLIQVQVEH